jgi:hypothetical protein
MSEELINNMILKQQILINCNKRGKSINMNDLNCFMISNLNGCTEEKLVIHKRKSTKYVEKYNPSKKVLIK